MRRYILFFVFFNSFIYAQVVNPEWRNYTVTDAAQAIIEEGNYFWLCTTGGLVKFNKTDFQFQVYNKGNSLIPSNNVFSAAVDNEGYKWICTFNGLVRFKDDEWIVFNSTNSGLPQDHLTSIAIDENNIKWIGTAGSGLAKYNDTVWTIYNTGNSDLPSNTIRTLNHNNNTLWVGTASGVAIKTGNNFTFLSSTAGKIVNSADIDVHGNLWFAVGYYSINNKGLYKLTALNNLTQFSGLSGNAIKIDNNNVKWFAFKEQISGEGLLTVDSAETNTTYEIQITQMVTYPFFYSFHFDNDGTRWFGAAQGLLKLDQAGTDTLIQTSNNKLGRDYVTRMFIDRHDRKWFYAWGTIPLSSIVLPPGYLTLNTNDTWTLFNELNSPVTITGITAAAEGAGTDMYFSVYDYDNSTELYKYNSGAWTLIPVPPTQYDHILYMWYDQITGKLWVDFDGANYQNNLFTYDGSGFTPVGAYPFYDINMAERKDNIIWFASPEGLVKYDGVSFTSFTTSNSGLPHNNVTSIDIDSEGNLWAGTGAGIVKYDGSSWVVYNSSNSPLTCDNISDIVIDSLDNIYIGIFSTYNDPSIGLVRFNGSDTWRIFNNKNSGKPEPPLSHLFPSTSNSLPEDVLDLSLDARGKIWVATDGGVGVYDKDGIPVPVELLEYRAEADGNSIVLNWSTATETNNKGFELLRSLNGASPVSIAFIEGAGTSTMILHYTYNDNNLPPGKYNYILQQHDLDGIVTEIGNAEAEVSGELKFYLSQNYPNPFNPETTFRYGLAEKGKVLIRVFDILGTEIETLVDESKEPGTYQVTWNAAGLPSGIYFMQFNAGPLNTVRKMLLLK